MVYNCRGRYEASTGGAPLTGAGARPEDHARNRTRVPTLWAVFTLAAALVIAGCGASGGGSSAGEDAAGEAASGGGKGGGEKAKLGVPSLGREDAPVVMTEYSDYQWPFCGKFAREVEPELYEKYVKDGTLKIEWRDFPYQGRESVLAALAARAAQAQGSFWEYHDLVYANQSSGNSGGYNEESLTKLAGEAGLDVERFRRDLEGARYEAVVQADFRQGQDLGISGTPTFVINGQALVGLQPLETFEEAIEEAEREAEGG